VLYDSAGEFDQSTSLNTHNVQQETADTRGVFRDRAGRTWLTVTFPVGQDQPNSELIVFAAPRPRGVLLNYFGENLLWPLIQAGSIAIVLAVILAIVISNSVARPLQRASTAATAIASGDYGHQVPEKGPAEVQELAHSLNQMAQRVQQTQHTQRDFLANVSHELKTPLTSIQGYAQAIVDGAAAQPGYAANVIFSEASRMHRLVEDLLDLARIESGETPLNMSHVRLADLLASVVKHLALRAEEKHIHLIHRIDAIPSITGDNDRLAQVFTNLIDNALTHTPTGGTVSISAHSVNRGIEVVIADTGKGIPPAELERIFERFYQVDKSRARTPLKGTGLGLTITKEIIEAHGGTILAASVEGQGTKFRVWLPLARHSDETVPRIAP
jgi:signal transduction histidine kinase